MKSKSYLLIFLLFLSLKSTGQQSEIEQIWQNYTQYQEASIQSRLFKHSDLLPLIEKQVKSNLLRDEIIGESVNKRSIHHLTAGTGKTKVLLWSQMHGDEATATMALFDLFNFLSANDQFNPLRNKLLNQLELHFVPMLNPDGAQIWTRRNSMNIDLNRDAKNLATPEARALMHLGKQLNPAFGFNLHDQSTLYAAGKNTRNPATISFLAPAYNTAKEMNAVRTKAVQVIATVNKAIQTKIPNQVAKYNDTHDSTCFGDTFQGMGISTVLIESGGYQNDPDKQFIRKVNFYSILTALDAIASENYLNENVENYWALPNNNRNLHDVIVRKVDFKDGKTDLGINRNQRLSADFLTMNFAGTIVKVADLDSTFAYQEVNADGLHIVDGKTKILKRLKWEKLTPKKEMRIIKRGYLFVKWKNELSPVGPIQNRLLNLTNADLSTEISVAEPANFILAKGRKPVYALINGFVIDLSSNALPVMNAMGY
ncbi:M14 family zinc carboxypeptidase [Pedobacter sp. Du54]|uniref:M14 family zinc carboxypeptidase n=1 Tax=Pedobacter anseongensis TaxID=3133439 RepID=UPI0030AC2E92